MNGFGKFGMELSLFLRRARRRLFSRQAWVVLHIPLPIDATQRNIESVSFREAKREDLEELAASLPDELAGHLTEARRMDLVTSRLNANIPCVVAVDDRSGKMVAGCWCTPLRDSSPINDLLQKPGRTFEISTLFVLPESRGSGIGSWLVAYACDSMYQMGYGACVSLVWYTRPASIKAHLKAGFQPIGEKMTVSLFGWRRTFYRKEYRALNAGSDRGSAA